MVSLESGFRECNQPDLRSGGVNVIYRKRQANISTGYPIPIIPAGEKNWRNISIDQNYFDQDSGQTGRQGGESETNTIYELKVNITFRDYIVNIRDRFRNGGGWVELKNKMAKVVVRLYRLKYCLK